MWQYVDPVSFKDFLLLEIHFGQDLCPMAADGDQCAWLLRILVICLVPILYGPLLGNPLMPIHEGRVSDTQVRWSHKMWQQKGWLFETFDKSIVFCKRKVRQARQLGISILSSGSNLDSNSLSFKGCGCRRPHSISFASQRSAGKCLHAVTRLWLVWSRDQTTSSWSHPHCLYTGILVALLGNRY